MLSSIDTVENLTNFLQRSERLAHPTMADGE